jgi:hypothetical protein
MPTVKADGHASGPRVLCVGGVSGGAYVPAEWTGA